MEIEHYLSNLRTKPVTISIISSITLISMLGFVSEIFRATFALSPGNTIMGDRLFWNVFTCSFICDNFVQLILVLPLIYLHLSTAEQVFSRYQLLALLAVCNVINGVVTAITLSLTYLSTHDETIFFEAHGGAIGLTIILAILNSATKATFLPPLNLSNGKEIKPFHLLVVPLIGGILSAFILSDAPTFWFIVYGMCIVPLIAPGVLSRVAGNITVADIQVGLCNLPILGLPFGALVRVGSSCIEESVLATNTTRENTSASIPNGVGRATAPHANGSLSKNDRLTVTSSDKARKPNRDLLAEKRRSRALRSLDNRMKAVFADANTPQSSKSTDSPAQVRSNSQETENDSTV